jgi:hypothetical protein
MNKTLRNTMIAAWMGMTGVGKVAKADGTDAKPRLAVCVRNYAKVPAGIMSRAEKVAQKIFEHASVETTWMEADVPTQNAEPNKATRPSCQTSIPLVNVTITPREMAAAYGLPANVLGLAPGKHEEHNRTVVWVFDQVADELVRKQSIASKSYILGHAMAHEIGHILTAQHTEAGIMRANWKEADFHAMMIGKLTFEPDQAERIQREVIRRSQQQASEMALLQ